MAAATRSQTRGPAGLSSLPAERLDTIWGGAPSSSWGLGFRINEGEQVLVAKMGRWSHPDAASHSSYVVHPAKHTLSGV